MLNDIMLSADGLTPSWRLTDETGVSLNGYDWSTAGVYPVGGGSLLYRIKYTPPYGILQFALEGRDNLGGATVATTITLPGASVMLNDVTLSADGLSPSWRLADGLGVSLAGYDWSTSGIYPVGGGSLQYRIKYTPPTGISQWVLEGRDNIGGPTAGSTITAPGTFTAAPSAPLTAIIIANAAGKNVVSWVPDPLATRYDVLRSTDGATFSRVSTVSASSATFIDLTSPAGATYSILSLR